MPEPSHAAAESARRRSLAVRTTVILLATASAIFWLLFAVAEFPLIVPADSISALVQEREQASLAGACLLVLSLLTISITAGFFGRGTFARAFAGLLVVGWLMNGLLLFPTFDVSAYPFRAAAYGLGIALVIAGGWTR
jgi:hypothetical protein